MVARLATVILSHAQLSANLVFPSGDFMIVDLTKFPAQPKPAASIK
jgi:hypothetical protein